MSQTPLDEWAGVEKGSLTAGARRLATLAATSWSFDKASEHLAEFAGIVVSDQTIRRVAHAEGRHARAWLEQSSLAVMNVHNAEGEPEFTTDGTMVNTREGWREVRLTICSKRIPGPPSDPARFTGLEHRTLNRPTARLALASKRSSDGMGRLWRETARRLGWNRHGGEGVSIMADGAKWIDRQVQETMPRATRVLDVYHMSQHLHECGAALYGEKTQAAREWAEKRLQSLVRYGPAIFLWSLEKQAESMKSSTSSDEAGRRADAIGKLLAYLRPHQESLRYGARLRDGLPIGSGQVEGACKTVIGRRLKLNSARWLPANTEPIASLCCLHYSDQWDTYWNTRAA